MQFLDSKIINASEKLVFQRNAFNKLVSFKTISSQTN
jgi:hypothetical protein